MLLYRILKPIAVFLVRLILPFKILKKERLFKNNGGLYICNHYTLLDVAFIASLEKGPVHFLGKSELFKSKLGKWFFNKTGVIPVNRDKTDASAILRGLKLLKAGNKLSVFPEGHRNKTKEEILEIQGGAGIFAIKSKCPIQPVIMVRKPKPFRLNYLMVGEPFELCEFYDKKITSADYDLIGNILKEKLLTLKNELREYLLKKGKKV
jgi:1-acyl-sn-glycerol-3-phosphate acyltransferase